MVDYAFTTEQDSFRMDLREYLEREMVPLTGMLENTEFMPREIIDVLARKKLLGMMVSQEFGGMATDDMTTGIAAEEIAITPVPDILHAQQEDIRDAARRIRMQIETAVPGGAEQEATDG